jgi:hypothetical protein
MYFTEVDNGLVLPWHGRVFVNPPYGREIRLWVQKARAECRSAAQAQPLASYRSLSGPVIPRFSTEFGARQSSCRVLSTPENVMSASAVTIFPIIEKESLAIRQPKNSGRVETSHLFSWCSGMKGSIRSML